MLITAQQLFKDLDQKSWKPVYLIVGEETFQLQEIVTRLKAHFIVGEMDRDFNYESFDAESGSIHDLIASLETLPGLFSESPSRLVICRQVDKLNPSSVEVLTRYLENPSETTCFVMLAHKADKRKSLYKHTLEKGNVLEVNEPYEREWPKWFQYLERKVGKRVAPDAWEILMGGAGKTLAVLWADLQRAATFVGQDGLITVDAVRQFETSGNGADVFQLAEDVVKGDRVRALTSFQELVRSGESEIKILSLLVRQFRQVGHYLDLKDRKITDSKTIAQQIGVHPFFVTKIGHQASHQNHKSIRRALRLAAECDFRLKTGEGGVFQDFLVPYFSQSPSQSY